MEGPLQNICFSCPLKSQDCLHHRHSFNIGPHGEMFTTILISNQLYNVFDSRLCWNMPWMLQYIFCFSMGNLNKFNIGLMRKVHTCKVVTEMGPGLTIFRWDSPKFSEMS